MTTIYQLMKNNKQIGGVYYNWGDAIDNAIQIVIDSIKIGLRERVEIWEAEEIEDIPYDALEWTKDSEVWL